MRMLTVGILLALAAAPSLVAAQQATTNRPRGRDLGIPFDGTPGKFNAITDVSGVEVGHTTLVSGSGKLERGKGPVRTGVTAILPRGRTSRDPVFAAWFSLNGNGEMTGTTWIDEGGMLEGPVMITNTHSIGVVHDAVVKWTVERGLNFWALPVVAETYDGMLNDINGFHVKTEHAIAALDGARGGPVAEGSVGGGTGMLCNGFKGGIGTSSRTLTPQQGGHTVGVLVQCNYGSARDLRIAGVLVGREFSEPTICAAGGEPANPLLRGMPRCPAPGAAPAPRESERELPEVGSIIIVVATDAPLLPHQLERIAKRAALGIGRMGGMASNGSGDIFIAFSTANAALSDSIASVAMLPNDRIDPILLATVRATEEAITNAMLAADTMTGADDVRALGLPHDRVVAILKKYGRIQ